MTIASRFTLASTLLATLVVPAIADDLRPPSSIDTAPPVVVVAPRAKPSPLATTERWGGGVRLTGLSGIGALPGVNYGGEVAGFLRRDEYFIELGFGRWRPEETQLVTETPERIELGLDVWSLRAGWASMKMPLRGWALAEVGEVAGERGMPGVVARMVMGDTPQPRQWRALGAGFGVAWPMSDQTRLFGSMELAIPMNRGYLMVDHGEPYKPEALAARCSIGLEVGWR